MFIGSFIASIVSTILSCFGVYIFNQLVETSQFEGLARLSLLVAIPVYLIIGLIMLSLMFTAVVSSIKSIGSNSKIIKIISIIILLIDIAIIGIVTYLTGNLINNLK